MFTLERDLVEKFITCLEEKTLDMNISNYSSEFNYLNGKTDIIAKQTNNNIVAFEAKLNNIQKVINQAYRNTAFANFSYIVLPATKKQLQLKYCKEIDKLEIGVILIDDDHAWIEKHAGFVQPILPWLAEKASTVLSSV